MTTIFNVNDVKPGMYLAKICGAWLEHPFWKKEFILKEEHIALLQRSKITEVGIDLSKSVIHNSDTIKVENTPICNNIPIEEKKVVPIKVLPNTSLSAEIKKAKTIVKNASTTMQRLFTDARMGKAIEPEQATELVNEINACQ